MSKNADAIIVGGGIIGLSAAFYLARARFGRIIVLEKEQFLGAGSTSKAAGGIRAQFSSEVNIRMSMLSEKLFRQFKEDTGSDALFDQVGYMFLLNNDEDIAQFKKSVELQKSLGLPVELLKPEDIPQYAPHVRLDDIKLATFCHEDGLADPHEFLSGYEKAARKLGVEIVLESEVARFEHNDNKISKIATKDGNTYETNVVINAAGAFAGQIAELAGVELKVQPIKRQCVTTGELDFVKPFFPMVVDVASGLYCHKESKGMLLGWADKSVEPSFDISLDPDYTDSILERALDRIPQLETAEIANQWAGLYETTPDHRAVIGFDPKLENLFHLAGFSGHGLMHAPAAGLVCSQLVTGQETEIDIAELSPDRFNQGELAYETNVI